MAIRFWFKVQGTCPGCEKPLPFKRVLFSGDPILKKWTVPRETLRLVLEHIANHPGDWMECQRCYSIGYQTVWLGLEADTIIGPYCPGCIPKIVRDVFGVTIPVGFFGIAVARSEKDWRVLEGMAEQYRVTGDIHGGESNGNGHLIF